MRTVLGPLTRSGVLSRPVDRVRAEPRRIAARGDQAFSRRPRRTSPSAEDDDRHGQGCESVCLSSPDSRLCESSDRRGCCARTTEAADGHTHHGGTGQRDDGERSRRKRLHAKTGIANRPETDARLPGSRIRTMRQKSHPRPHPGHAVRYTAMPHRSAAARASCAPAGPSGSNPSVTSGRCRRAYGGAVLVRAFDDPSDDEARANTLLAASYAGVGFGNAGVPVSRDVVSRVGGVRRIPLRDTSRITRWSSRNVRHLNAPSVSDSRPTPIRPVMAAGSRATSGHSQDAARYRATGSRGSCSD